MRDLLQKRGSVANDHYFFPGSGVSVIQVLRSIDRAEVAAAAAAAAVAGGRAGGCGCGCGCRGGGGGDGGRGGG